MTLLGLTRVVQSRSLLGVNSHFGRLEILNLSYNGVFKVLIQVHLKIRNRSTDRPFFELKSLKNPQDLQTFQ